MNDGVEMKQRTLSGGEQLLIDIEELRERPDTFRWCHHCEDWVLRTRWSDHDEHDWRAQREAADDDDRGDEEDEDDPERVGAWYEIELSYSMDYSFRVPAWSEHQAEDLAKEWHWDTKPHDRYHVHTNRREVKEITSDDPDLPDDWDPYGDERLWEAIERGKEDDSE